MHLIVRFMSPQLYYTAFIVCCVTYSGVEGIIISGPANTAEIVGLTAELKCTISERTCDGVIWSTTDANGQIVTISVDTRMRDNFRGRYHVSVSAVGECCLNINEVQLSDAGIFTCDASTPTTGTERKSSVLSVLASSPQLSSNAEQTAPVERDIVQLSCSLAYKSKLQVTVEIIQAGQVIYSQYVSHTHSSIHKYAEVTARRNEDLGPFRCRVILTQNARTQENAELARNDVEFHSNELPAFNVQFPVGRSAHGDAVPCNLEPAVTTFAPGESVKCLCDGFPEPTYQWIRRPYNVTIIYEQVISLNQSTSSSYQCVGTNVINGLTYMAFSPEVHFNGTDPMIPHLYVIVSAGASLVAGVLLVIGIAILMVCKKKKTAHSSSDAVEESNKSSIPLPVEALSHHEYELLATAVEVACSIPSSPPDLLPSPSQLVPSTTTVRRPLPNAPVQITPGDDDAYLVPVQPVSPSQPNSRASEQIDYETPILPQEPPRPISTPTQSDTEYEREDGSGIRDQ